MERFSELSIILKGFPYQERDKVVVFLTENHGKFTALAKGAIHSRRFGGTLDFLSCSRIHYIQKPHAEMARIEEAIIHHEFKNLQSDFNRLTAASFAAEFCLRLLEPHNPLREMFLVLSNLLHQLDSGMPVYAAVNAFLCKAFKAMGYSPSLLRCVQCGKGAHEIIQTMHWYSEAGGMICGPCSGQRFKFSLESGMLLQYHKFTMQPFKHLAATLEEDSLEFHAQLYRVLSDFFHHHIPGIPGSGFKSWKLLNEAVMNELAAN